MYVISFLYYYYSTIFTFGEQAEGCIRESASSDQRVAIFAAGMLLL